MVTVDIFSLPKYTILRDQIQATVEKTLRDHGVTGDAEVSVSFVGELKMKTLHKKYMETYETTDVLSFPLEGVMYPDNVTRLGDVVVCYPVAVAQAKDNNRSVHEEINFLVEHSCLHLLGIHHE